jgi:secreted trypsin-like serine protease
LTKRFAEQLRRGLLLLSLAPALANAHGGRRIVDETQLLRSGASTEPTKKLRRNAHDAVVALVGPRGLVCSGVLVHPELVLTARHCLGARRVVFGADLAEPRLVREVLQRTAPENRSVDLALFRISAVAVAPYPVRPDSKDGTTRLTVVGFGATDFRNSQSSGRRSYFSLESARLECSPTQAQRTGCAPGHEFALSASAGVDTCTGDSGGPVLSGERGAYEVVGITSRSALSSLLPCGDGGVYVRTDVLSTWIQKQIETLK